MALVENWIETKLTLTYIGSYVAWAFRTVRLMSSTEIRVPINRGTTSFGRGIEGSTVSACTVAQRSRVISGVGALEGDRLWGVSMGPLRGGY